MLGTARADPQPGVESFFELFPHRFDYLYAAHAQPGDSPAWQTESRHPLTDRLLQQGSYLYGVRFGPTTRYCLLDIDLGSRYHPDRDPWALDRIMAALEPLGLVSFLVCTSSYSGGLHLYLPFSTPQSSWKVGAAVSLLLENAGFLIKPGQLEVFPNRRSYSIQGKPALFNGHRLPLQAGSYLLNASLEPVWADRAKFVQQWQLVQDRNQISTRVLRQVLTQGQRRYYQVSGRAAKFLNDLNAEIEPGWTGRGQTNYLLGRITLRAYVFHHILTDEPALTGERLIAEVIKTACQLPGYRDWCQHQHELEHRVAEWARCVEASRYFHYGETGRNAAPESLESPEEPTGLSWNQQQCQAARQRIQTALATLLNQQALPGTTTARFKALTSQGISGSSLYRHRDLWHPDFMALDTIAFDSNNLDSNDLGNVDPDLCSLEFELTDLELTDPELADSELTGLGKSCGKLVPDFGFLAPSNPGWVNQLDPEVPEAIVLLTRQLSPTIVTSLFPQLGRNALPDLGFSDLNGLLFDRSGCNPASGQVFADWVRFYCRQYRRCRRFKPP